MTANVILSGIGHRFGAHTALSGIELAIDAGEYVTLLGPSGCGKTTLLSILGGFIEPTEGHVLIGGEDMTRVPPARRPTTTMFQDYALFPHMSLEDNVAFGLRMAGVARAERQARARTLLALLGLPDAARKRPHELSGGQRQRVALARALAVRPDVLLLDEPLGALDLKLRRAMQDELKRIQRQVGTTFVHVTHDQEEAMAIADRIVVMNRGRIEDEGTPTRVYQAPATRFAADFMGEMNHLPGQRVGDAVDTRLGRLPLIDRPDGKPHDSPRPRNGTVTVCIRPEAIGTMGAAAGSNAGAIEASNAGATVDLGMAKVQEATFFGTHYRVHLQPDIDSTLELVAHWPTATAPRRDDRVHLSTTIDAIHVFPDEGPT